MSKNNRSAKKELERIYGKGCFFERAHIAERGSLRAASAAED